MLRYQNKYRSTVRTRPELVRGVMERLNEQGRAYVSPYAGEESPVELTRLKKRFRSPKPHGRGEPAADAVAPMREVP